MLLKKGTFSCDFHNFLLLEYKGFNTVVGLKMQSACSKLLEFTLGKLVMFAPGITNLLLVGSGSATSHVQKPEEKVSASKSLHKTPGEMK